MAWTAVASPYFSTGQVVNATNMNALSDNLRYLKGTDGPTVLEDRLTIPLTASGNGKGLRFGNGTTQYANLQGMDLSSSSYVFFGTNRQYDGSAWQQLSTRAGGVVQITQDEFAYYTFPSSSSTPTNRFQIKNTGYVGIGTATPAGPLHVVGAAGGIMFLSAAAVAGSAVTLAVADTVTRSAFFWLTDHNNTSNTGVGAMNGTQVLVNSSTTYTNTDTITVAVTAGGAITVQRTSGTNGTHDIRCWVQYG